MRFSIDPQALKRAVGLLGAVVPKKNNPIFECARIVLGPDSLQVQGTDLERAITLRVPVTDCEGGGECAVP